MGVGRCVFRQHYRQGKPSKGRHMERYGDALEFLLYVTLVIHSIFRFPPIFFWINLYHFEMLT